MTEDVPAMRMEHLTSEGVEPDTATLERDSDIDARIAPAAVRRPNLAIQLWHALRAMRLKQWTKNGLVVLAAVFSRTLTNLPTVERVALAFLAFGLAASSIYILNDIADREKDRLHPKKRLRPIAAGKVSIPVAVFVAALCITGAIATTAYMLFGPLYASVPRASDPAAAFGGSGALFAASLASYVLLNVAYSARLKHLVLWDVFSIAAGFVLRAVAGAFAAAVVISPWFYLCTIFLSLFLALGKRRAELVSLAASAGTTRQNLRQYTVPLLDQLMTVVVTCALMAYSLYTFQGENADHYLMLTIPFVIFGVCRYMYLVYVQAEGERPDELLWKDRQILGAVVLCIVAVATLLYGHDVLGLFSAQFAAL